MRRTVTAVLVLCSITSWAHAGLGPQNTAVVVNADSFASRAVANEYILRRQIPACNVIDLHLAQLPDFEQIAVEDFRKLVLLPVLEQIRARGLSEQIDCIAYSSDIPYAVQVTADIAQQKQALAVTPVAAVNGLTFLYQQVLAADVGYLKLDANHYAQRVINHPRRRLPRDAAEQVGKAGALAREQKWAEAAEALAEVAKAHPASYDVQYDLGCFLARCGKLDEALAALTRAVDAGFWNAGLMKDDDDLNPLKQRPEFQTLVARIKIPPIAVEPVRGFQHDAEWEGQKYLLSTMLAVTSGRGNSVGEACDMLRRSVAADGTRPAGTIYYLLNGDIRAATRKWGFQAAVDRLRELKVGAEVVEGVLPKDKPDVAGAMVGIADFDWRSCGSTILPGAICEHLTSFGGVMVQNAGQTPISAFIRAGAAGSSGTVTEPYAIQAKFPTPFLHVYYAQGATLAEAFYLSVTGPYQLLILGDPLCRPWARVPTVSVSSVTAEQVLQDTVALQAAVKPDDPPAARFELFVDGRRHAVAPCGEDLKLDPKQLPAGYHELRVVAIGADSLATQGQTVLPVYCGESPACTVQLPPNAQLAWGPTCDIGLDMPGMDRIELQGLGQVLGTVAGSKGVVKVDARQLGLGTVRLQPIGYRPATAGQHAPVYAKPLDVTVTPPPVLPARAVDGANLAQGIRLRAGDRAVVLDTGTLPEALAKASLQPAEAFSLEGYFDVPTQDLYQLQLRFRGQAALEVDAVPLVPAATGLWSFMPVQLAPGTHHLKATFTPSAGPHDLDLRFGGQGAQTLQAHRFRCSK
jgi:tetratricopeptide (TPR) repeat protein